MLQLLLVGRKPLPENWNKYGGMQRAEQQAALQFLMHITHKKEEQNRLALWPQTKEIKCLVLFFERGVGNFPLAHILFFFSFFESLNRFFFSFFFNSILYCAVYSLLCHNSDVRNHKISVRKIQLNEIYSDLIYICLFFCIIIVYLLYSYSFGNFLILNLTSTRPKITGI
jgi:hypothetical protein